MKGTVPTSSEARDRDSTELRANKWARRAAAVVLVVGGILILVPPALNQGEIWENPFEPASSTTKVVTQSPDGTATTKTTTAEASRSFVERSLAAGGLVLLRIGIVALAAFLAGAVVQRTLLGNFAMKLGPLEVPEQTRRAAEASASAVAVIEEELGRQKEATERAMNVAAGVAEGLAGVREALEKLGVDLGQEPDVDTIALDVEDLEPGDETNGALHFEPEEKDETE